MKKKALPVITLFAAMMIFAGTAAAESPQIGKDDTLHTVLASQKGKQATVKLASGEELTGKVGEVTGKLVLLQALSGKEFFDAVINLEDVAAVIIRARE